MAKTSRTIKTAVLSTGKALTSLSSIVTAMVLIRLFSKEDWGTYRQTMLVFMMASPLLSMGLSNSIMYFLPTEKKEQQGRIILEAACVLSLAGFLYFLVIIFGGNELIAQAWNNPRLATLLMIVAPVALFTLATQIVTPSLIATQRVTKAAVFGVVTGLSLAIVSVITALICPTLEVVIAARIVAHIALFMFATIWIFKFFPMKAPTWKGTKLQLAYGLPLGLSTAVGVIFRNVDRAMVSSFCEIEQFAIFDRGAMELPLIGVITGSMTAILLVDYKVMFSSGKMEEVLPLLHRAVEKSAIMLMPMMCFLFLLAPEFMVCMFGQEYLESHKIFRVYLLLLPCRTLVFGSIALAAGKTKELALIPMVALVINVFLNFFAIKTFGYIGSAFATVFVIYFISNLGRALLARKVLGCTLIEFLPFKIIGKAFLLSFLSLVPVILTLPLLASFGPLLRFTICLATYVSVIAVVFWKFNYIDKVKLKKQVGRLTMIWGNRK